MFTQASFRLALLDLARRLAYKWPLCSAAWLRSFSLFR